MSEDEARRAVIQHLMAKTDKALAAAPREHTAGDLGLAVNRVYYACFYAASAVLLRDKRQFVKHAGVRAAIHQHLVKPGTLSTAMGKFYDEAFKERQEADYGLAVEFDSDAVTARIEQPECFVTEMRRLLDAG
ncbi:MAG: HEPN domain-containing protein [bacterium]|nr:HEPN domain-containing protein [bacterium]